MFRYAFVEFLQDIAKWLVIGLAIAALIAVFIPDDFFASYLHNDLLGMLVILAASIPVYVCATVITSYSIHYTKLYEHKRKPVWRLPE